MKKILYSLLGFLLGGLFFASQVFSAPLRVFTIPQGGTGTSTPPTEGDLLIGNSMGTYDFVPSSSLPYLTSYTETDPVWTAVSSTFLTTSTASITYLQFPFTQTVTNTYSFDGSEDNNTLFVVDNGVGSFSINIDPSDFSDGTTFTFTKDGSDGVITYLDAGSGNTIGGSQTYLLYNDTGSVTLTWVSSTQWAVTADANVTYDKISGLVSYIDLVVQDWAETNFSYYFGVEAGSMAYEDTGDYYTSSSVDTLLGDYVPYTGATGHVDLGNYNLSTNLLNLNSTALGTSTIGNIEFYGDDYFVNISTAIDGSQYPPAQNNTYVDASSWYSTTYVPWNATDPTKSLTGTLDNGWVSGNSQITNQTIHIDLGVKRVITKLYYENGHQSGAITNAGAKTYTIWGSNDASAFADTTYGTDTNWTQLTTTSTFDQHVASNVADPKYKTWTNTTAYRYYRIKIADSYGYAFYMMIRRLELQAENDYRKNIVTTDGGTLSPTYIPFATTNGRLADSSLYYDSTNDRFGFGTESPAYKLDVNDSARFQETLYLGEGLSTSGLQPLIRGYVASAYRTLMGVNGTTGKLVYYAPGGTQGLDFLSYNRAIEAKFDGTAGYGLTANTTDRLSAGQHHFQIQTYMNGSGTYDSLGIILTDNASNAESNYFALYSLATYGSGTPTLGWRVRKDFKLFGQASQWDVTSAQQYGNQLNHTWNNSGTTYIGLDVNITNTSSGSGSKVFDFSVGGTSKLSMDGSGDISFSGLFNINGGIAPLASNKLADFTVDTNTFTYYVITSVAGADVTATLPASPSDNEMHFISLIDPTYNLIIDGNGINIVDGAGSSSSKTLSTYETAMLQYRASIGVWYRLKP